MFFIARLPALLDCARSYFWHVLHVIAFKCKYLYHKNAVKGYGTLCSEGKYEI